MCDADHRHMRHAELLGHLQPEMTRNNGAVLVDDDRIDEAEAADNSAQLLDLLLAVSSRVTFRGPDLLDRARLDLGMPEGSRLGPDRCRAGHESRHGLEVSENNRSPRYRHAC